MPSERIQRQIDRLLDEADHAIRARDWGTVRERALAVREVDPGNADAAEYLALAEKNLGGPLPASEGAPVVSAPAPEPAHPTAFGNGRYQVKRFLGEGGKKRVYLAHDTTLDRDVAFALIKTEGLDQAARLRVAREAQAMGRLGAHPHIVTVFDLGDEAGQPTMVTELLAGGDVEGLLERTPEHQLPLDQALRLADQVLQGLEFAHGHGIVHRDLKPGNVWLTAEGVAKIGDFGLAVATDRSRLTQAGMMVGTVSYMPPEQAMGGAVTPRSDLYAFGAMLYELLCGRPPFVGEETVAIVTQHLNTPPVAPSWHRPDCPPGLEALVLRLLEKDPSKRPASASEVRGILAGLATAPAASAAEVAPSTDNPLYRRVFVGRESELKQLQGAFDGALSGQGGLVMVVGEPGIGKTALCEQLATYAAMRGGKALVGHCYEEGSLSLPYLPFVEAIRSYVLAREPEQLRDELGGGASEVARIVSEVRDKVAVEPRASGDPEDDRWRLYQGVTGFLRGAGTVQPLLIILEDLHWADRGTLDFLVHLARNLQGARLLLVGTYRDVEVDRAHPLSGTLGELRRAANFGRVPLRGLTADEVHRMINGLTAQDVRWSLAEAVHRQTEGNPLFIQEVLRYLVEEGHISHEGGRWHREGDTPPEMHIPEGLRDVIGRRLSRLSPECNRLLAIAAVIGRDFDLPVLQAVAGASDDALTEALEEAVRIGVLETQARPGVMRFRFTHAFFRQTLYEEIFAMRRVRLHQQVGRALEQVYGRRVDDHAAELAEHFSQSTEIEDGRKALHYSELAARRAMAVYAYGEAVRHLEMALQVLEALDPDDKAKRCDLLLALGEALGPAGDPDRVSAEIAPEALRLAEALGDDSRAGSVAMQALDAIHRFGAATSLAGPAAARWLDAGNRYVAAGTADGVRLNWYMAVRAAGSGDLQRAHTLRVDALERARTLGDPLTLLSVIGWVVTSADAPLEQQARLRSAQEIAAWDGPKPVSGSWGWGVCLFYAGHPLLEWGDRATAERLWRELEGIAPVVQDPSIVLRAPAPAIILAVWDGRLEEALRSAAVLREQAERLGSPAFGAQISSQQSFRAALLLGRYDEAFEFLKGHASIFGGPRIPLGLHCLGRDVEARDSFEQFLVEHQIGPEPDYTSVTTLVFLLEAALALADRERTEWLARRLEPVAGMVLAWTGAHTAVARHLGAAAALLGDIPQAEAYYRQALEVCEKVRFRPEIALARLGLAELLLDHHPGRRAEAVDHLDVAIGEFRAIKMAPALERALGRKGMLGA